MRCGLGPADSPPPTHTSLGERTSESWEYLESRSTQASSASTSSLLRTGYAATRMGRPLGSCCARTRMTAWSGMPSQAATSPSRSPVTICSPQPNGRRFTQFANAVRKERTIGICHGDAGVGKTNSARRYANWDALEPYINEWGPRGDHDAKHYALANRSRTVFYTPKCSAGPRRSWTRSTIGSSRSEFAPTNTSARSTQCRSSRAELRTWWNCS